MSHVRSRLLVGVAALLLVLPFVLPVDGFDVRAQDVADAPLSEAMPADIPIYIASELDLGNGQYLQLGDLLAETLVPGVGGTIGGLVQTVAGFVADLPSGLGTALQGEVGIGIANLGSVDLSGALGGNQNGTVAMAQSLLPGYGLVLHPFRAGEARPIVEAWYRDRLKAIGVEPQLLQDGSVTVLRNPDAGSAESANLPGAIAFSGDYIILGANVEGLAPFIGATQGTIPTLADDAPFRDLTAQLPSDELLFGYVDGTLLFDSILGIFSGSNLANSLSAPFGQTAFSISADEPGLRFESVSRPLTSLPVTDELFGSNPGFASMVPDTTRLMVAGQDLGQSWAIQQLQKGLLSFLAGSVTGGDVDLSGVDLDSQFGLIALLTGINFKTDLMDQLTGDWGAALFTLDTEDPLASSAVVASELEDVDRVSIAVTSLGPLVQSAGAGLASVTTASVDGQTVNNISLVDPIEATIQYGVVDDMLMVGLGDGVATLATPSSPTLAEDPAYQASLAELPERYEGVIYVDLQEVARDLAPLVLAAIANSTNNSLADCIAGSDPGTQDSAEPAPSGGAVETICSVIGGLFGPDAIQNFLISRFPGPLTAVSYDVDGFQRVSGILLVD